MQIRANPRIAQGVQSGTIDQSELGKLRKARKHNAVQRQEALSDGVISPEERQANRRNAVAASRHIAAFKNN